MTSVWAFAVITYREGIRNRSLFGVLLFALFVFGLNMAVAGFFMRDIGKVSIDMNLSALSFSGLLLVFFIGLNLIAKDIDKKTIQVVLSKPISRVQYLWGKFLGIQLFVLVSLLVLVAFSAGTLFLLGKVYPDYFVNFSWPALLLAIFFIFVKLSVLNAIVIFFSTITTSSFVTLVFSICAYLVGESIEDVVFFVRSGLSTETISPALQGFLTAISYILPNLSAFNFQVEAAHGLAVDPIRIILALGYAGVYVVLLLMLGALIFHRREFS